ncbi:MAG TPA: glycosyl hydrolase-related protein [Candidatus Eisenbacteria bacterium]|nr:glycosyl hydrolase-related protein [Candidatus Eisenbacteria bacterium]
MSDAPPRAILVSHFHWDREWHRTFEAYRARLVDAVDRVLDLLAADPGYRFLLDGQAIVLEDYLAMRPARRADLERGLRDGRLAVGPWYVQPDSLLPSGEAHVRNLLLGRRVGGALGPVSRAGYVPDSFGHPAQLPQILQGFGIDSFVYWRGNGNEIDRVGTWYRWEAPDGSAVAALLLRDGYFNAGCLPSDVEAAAAGLEAIVRRHEDEPVPALLMNGFDHMQPDPHVGAVAAALARRLGARVDRGLLEDVLAVRPAPRTTFRGELVGARVADLLPGVWSTRMATKLRNRRCEALLEGWAEPWAAFARRLGLPDERPAIERTWRTLLANQAHDSLCGCSLDEVMRQVDARLETVQGLAEETIARLLSRLAGQNVDRTTPPGLAQDVVIFNPSPHPRTDVVRIPLDAYPALRMAIGIPEFPELLLAADGLPGFTIDGRPVRVVRANDLSRVRWLPGQEPFDVELVATDVPAFGCRRLRLTPADPEPDRVDDGREIAAGGVRVVAADDGTLGVRFGERELRALLGVEDDGDRGDTYDFDPVPGDPGASVVSVSCERRRHASGIATLTVRRVLRVPRALAGDRTRRTSEVVDLPLVVEARVAPGVPRVDLVVSVDNTASDHRLRLVFPSGSASPTFTAATTFDTATRRAGPADDRGWVHRAPATFPHQGWVAVNGLTVVAPGLPEAEVRPDGTLLLTLVRSVGWISRFDLASRPRPAGPAMVAPGAQSQGRLVARISLLADADARAARAAELGLRGVIGGPSPRLASGDSLLAVEPREVVVTAVKPAEEGDGVIVRLLNPTDAPVAAVVRFGVAPRHARAVRLDEEPAPHAIVLEGDTVRMDVPPHALRSVLVP